MDRKLLIQAAGKFAAGVLMVGVLLFAPAGTLRYPGAWRLMALLFLPVLAVGIVLLCKKPDLLRKRLNAKEALAPQSLLVQLSGIMFLAGFAAAGVSFRFGFLPLPAWTAWPGVIALLLGFGLYAEVLRENAWLSRTVEVQAGQTLVDTGLYGLIRHPMYAATLLIFLAVPLILGSGLAALIFLCYPILIAGRIRSEETLLRSALPGYAHYMERVRWRLIPFIW